MILTTSNNIISNEPTIPSTLQEAEKLWSITTKFAARQADPLSSHIFDQESQQNTQSSTKRTLEYLFIGIAILVLGALIYRRMLIRTRRSQLRIAGFHRSEGDGPYAPRRTQMPMFDPYSSQSYPPRWGAFPAAHINPHGQTMRRTRAEDIDAGGRRIGDQNAELDHGQLGDKDALPAYDMNGGPPRYTDVQSPPQIGGVDYGLNRPVSVNTGVSDTIPPTVNITQAPPSPPQASPGSGDPHSFPLPRR